MTDETNGTFFAGDVKINSMALVSSTDKYLDIKPYFLEMSIHEDIFSSALQGEIIIADAISLVEKLPIIGEEYLLIDFETPGTDSKIVKSFRVYKIENRAFHNSDRTQTFILHFTSPEVFVDCLARVYRTYEGSVIENVEKIYKEFIQIPKTLEVVINDKDEVEKIVESKENNEIVIFSDIENKIKFNTNGWGALKVLNWLASKSISKTSKSADVLFFETTKNHYFSSISDIIKNYKDNKVVAGDYYIVPNNIRNTFTPKVSIGGVEYSSLDINRDYKIVEGMKVLENFDTLALTRNGYYSSRQIQFDIVNKTVKYNDFDYVEDFEKYTHLHDRPMFTKNQYRHPTQNVSVAYSHNGLYNNFPDNANERISEINQNRKSLLTGYGSMFRMEIGVPGRSDLECGSVVYFQMPEVGNKDQQDAVLDIQNTDEYYTGLYLVTAIRHKITQTRYMQTLELAKDCIKENYK